MEDKSNILYHLKSTIAAHPALAPAEKEEIIAEVEKAIDYYSTSIRREDYLATKLWCEEDVGMTLLEEGYADSEENIAKVINTGYLESLNDCTDSDWQIIRFAIREASGDLTPDETASALE